MIPKGVVIDGEVYINTEDLIYRIKDHMKMTDVSGDAIYKLDHEHIIDVIHHEERRIRKREENRK